MKIPGLAAESLRKRIKGLAAVALVSGCFAVRGFAGPDDPAGHVQVGQKMPDISAEEINGDHFTVAGAKGKVAVVNFWATWCPPCREEMPRLQKEIWQKYRSSEFLMVAIAREQTKETVEKFRAEHREYTFPMAFDPKRATYAVFADSGIPRTYVVDRRGTIVYQSLGYDPQEIGRLDRAIQKALTEK